ncbi:Nucleotidyltransferase domain protein [uncultured archaeon]|nr:Nucleotidyltransferase domain protein [uncultured archaeon]
MEQDISFEIMSSLMKGQLHARALAKKLGTNHMTIARKLKELVTENVLDFRTEGKNKVYFTKKSIEARSFAIMSEMHKLNKTLEKYPELRGVVEAVQKNPRIELAVLFGSYAKGRVREDSDIDVFIETKNRKMKQEIELLNTRLSVKIGGYDRENLLIKEIEKNHVIIKGAEPYYERNRFFY